MKPEELSLFELKSLDAAALLEEARRCHQLSTINPRAAGPDEKLIAKMNAERAQRCLRLWMNKTGRTAKSFADEIRLHQAQSQPRPAQRPPKTVSTRVFSRWGRGR